MMPPQKRRHLQVDREDAQRIFLADEIEQDHVGEIRRRELVMDHRGSFLERRWMWPQRAWRSWCGPSGAQSIRPASGTHVQVDERMESGKR
jgi:hypothetical protein